MRVELAEKAGYCFGVNRAVDMVYQEIIKDKDPVYTYGPIIHNEEVIRDMEDRGVHVINSLEEARELPKGHVIIRSHGVTQKEYKTLEANGFVVVDATCPFVKRIHQLVHEFSKKGYFIVVIGDVSHPEVKGIVGWSDKEHTAVVGNAEEAQNLSLDDFEKICIVSQTTFNFNNFQDLVEIIRKKRYDKKSYGGETVPQHISIEQKDGSLIVHNTICSATQERQEAARELSQNVDAMFVIGGTSSSNTRKLYEICSENCKNTYFIQTKEDLECSEFPRFDYVGITAGASTPKNIIEEVQKYVRDEF